MGIFLLIRLPETSISLRGNPFPFLAATLICQSCFLTWCTTSLIALTTCHLETWGQDWSMHWMEPKKSRLNKVGVDISAQLVMQRWMLCLVCILNPFAVLRFKSTTWKLWCCWLLFPFWKNFASYYQSLQVIIKYTPICLRSIFKLLQCQLHASAATRLFAILFLPTIFVLL